MPPTPPLDTATLSGLVALYRASSGYAAGAWEDIAGAESADEATNPPTYSASDAKFNNTPSLTFDGTNDVLLDTRAASAFNFVTEYASGTEWTAWIVFSTPTTVGTVYPVCIGYPTGAGNSGFAVQRLGNLVNVGIFWGGTGQNVTSRAITTNTATYVIFGHKSASGANNTYIRAKRSGAAYSDTTTTRTSANAACAASLTFGRNAQSNVFASMSIAEFGIGQFALDKATADGMAAYFVQQYGATP